MTPKLSELVYGTIPPTIAITPYLVEVKLEGSREGSRGVRREAGRTSGEAGRAGGELEGK